ncbi:MAG: tRNA dihydrouridine synthase DusB [Bacilli bacterium]|nr:tRNA dihydrouridine synthase DusB [Bacilli bacterium]MBQ6539027.1 tRNA dihydrouridine synthase DusB [Bacilli bacterium]
MEWKIGDVVIKNKVVLAPMAGVTNSAYRKICKEMGAGLVFAEMVSDKAIVYNNKKTIDMLYMKEEERPLAQQIFGADVDSFVEATKYIEENMKPDIIDINMGCPVPKVAVRAQAGSALLKNPDKIYEVVKAVVDSVKVPVTVKIRSGWDNNHINAVEVAKMIEKAGASAITIHPRTRSQGYSGKADWKIIKEVKDAVSIPVIGNGDIKNSADAKRMLEETGCDAIMIGRGVLGNPWLIKNILLSLDGKEEMTPTIDDRIEMIKKHINYLLEFKSERQVALEIRTHIGWYLKGIKNSNEIKNKIFKTTSINEIISLIEELKVIE